MHYLPIAALGFILTLLAILILRPLAEGIDLLDRPGGRKMHQGAVPIVGGLGMFFGLVVGLGLMQPPIAAAGTLMGAFAILVVTGLFDDRYSLSQWTRLGVHLAVAMLLVVGTHSFVVHIGNPFGGPGLTLSTPLAMVFPVLLIVAAINAFNMIDGMDGLAAVTTICATAGLAALAHMGGSEGEERAVAVVTGAAVCAFMVFNVPVPWNRKLRCFMGDAGSTLLGAVVAWLCIRASQVPVHGAVHPVTVLWIVGLPLFEVFWSVMRRMGRGRSPLDGDAEHFHHLLVRGGVGVRTAFLMFALLNVVLAGVGLELRHLDAPDWVSLVLLVAMGVVVVRGMYRMHWVVRWVPVIGGGGAEQRGRAVE